MSKILVCGGSGFIATHLIKRLKENGHWVRSVDLVARKYEYAKPDEEIIGDLRNSELCLKVCIGVDEVYQLAADMGGAGYTFTGEHDSGIMHNSVLCNVNILHACRILHIAKIFYSSSACIYPYFNQEDPENPNCEEESAYPALPDSEYGWEKLFSERLYLAYKKDHKIDCKIGRFHNVYGPYGTWQGGKEKSPAAVCRKVALADPGESIEIWGNGKQTRSFLYIGDCVDAMIALMKSDFSGPVNIGSEEMVSINELAQKVIALSKKQLTINHIPGPIGVNGRKSHNALIKKKLGWEPKKSLLEGLAITYNWITREIANQKQLTTEDTLH